MQRSTLTLALSAVAAVLAGGSLAVSVASFEQSRQVASTLATAPSYVDPAAVKAALLSDPRMLVEAGQRLQALNETSQREASRALVEAAAKELAEPTRGFLGNPDGKRVVVEFFDYQCEHCRNAMPFLARAIAEDPELKIVLRDIPLLGPGSEIAARVALAAARQDRYMPVHEALMQLPLPIVPETALLAAVNAGADRARLEADIRRWLTW